MDDAQARLGATEPDLYPIDEREVRQFWQDNACGDEQVGGLHSRFGGDYEKFFTEYDRFRYSNERHLLDCLTELHVVGKQVLEIGLGEGSDSEQLIRRGAEWSGLDLTAESVARVKTRLALRDLPYRNLRQGSVLNLPFADDSFDMVFSHGVLHHVPDIKQAEQEINRVLRPDGELVIMMYARWSLNYLISIGLIRRAGLLLTYPLASLGVGKPASAGGSGGPSPRNGSAGTMLADHLDNARNTGLLRYLRMAEFIHHNTDGPGNPYSAVYDRRRVAEDFPSFRIKRVYKRFMHAPPLPVHRLPGQTLAGWHLWAHLVPA